MSRPRLATTMARLLLLALLAVLVAHTPQAQAQAAGTIRYYPTQDGSPTYTPQYGNEQSLSLLLEARAADGRLPGWEPDLHTPIRQ